VSERHNDATTERAGAARSRRRRRAPRTVLAVAALGSAVAFVDATIVNIALPDIERSFPGTSISSISSIGDLAHMRRSFAVITQAHRFDRSRIRAEWWARPATLLTGKQTWSPKRVLSRGLAVRPL
jgi:hypothetical protein